MTQPPPIVPIVPGRPVQPAAPVPPAYGPPPRPAAKRGMSTGRILLIVWGSFGLLATAAVLIGITTNVQTTSSTPRAQPPSPPPQPPPPPVRSTTSTAPSVNVPGLPAEAAAHIGLTAATPVQFLGFDAYSLTVSTGGTGWAIKGTPAALVPKVITDPSYGETASVLFLSGSYVLYFPDLTDMPEAFNLHVGPRPGMSVIDTDLHQPPPPPVPAPPPAPPAPPPPALDPRFGTCAEAKSHGYGPYYIGIDPEYHWYRDADSDGKVCE